MTPNETWKLTGGTAHVYIAGDRTGLTRPFILLAPTKPSPTDLAAFDAGLGSFHTELLKHGGDLILVGYDDGAAPLAGLADVAVNAVRRSIHQRLGSSPLIVGGIGRGALIARYALERMEMERFNHETAVYFSYNGTPPAPNEVPAGGLSGPQQPRQLKLVSADFTSELSDEDFDDFVNGAANPGGSIITQELGQWLFERLS